MNTRIIICLFSFFIVSCGQTNTTTNNKMGNNPVTVESQHKEDYSNKSIYKVKRGETFKIYYTIYDFWASCWLNQNEAKFIRLNNQEAYGRDEKNPCIGCDYKVGMVFKAIKAGIDTIKFSDNIKPEEDCCLKAKLDPSTIAKAKRFIVIVSDSLYGDKANLTQADTSVIFQFADQKPVYIGGDEALTKIITANFDLHNSTTNEICYYRLAISNSGQVIEILKLRGEIANQQQLIQAIQKTSGKWIPGRKNEKKVNVYLNLTIKIAGENIKAAVYHDRY